VTDASEALARALHESFLRHRIASGEVLGSTPSLVEWDQLSAEFKRSSRRNARDLQDAVADLGYQVEPSVDAGTGSELARDEIEHVARRLHASWVEERIADGWRVGPVRDDGVRTNPDLVAWGELSEERRDIDRHFARELPRVLGEAGLVLVESGRGR
jgi:hypothetical protein